MGAPIQDPVLEFGKVCSSCGQPLLKKCSECGTPLLGYRKQSLTCSGKCRVARHRRLLKEAAEAS